MRPLRSRQEKALKWVISCCERDRTVRLLRSRQEKALKWLVSCYERDRTVRLLRSRRRRVGFRPAAAIRVALPGGGLNPDSHGGWINGRLQPPWRSGCEIPEESSSGATDRNEVEVACPLGDRREATRGWKRLHRKRAVACATTLFRWS